MSLAARAHTATTEERLFFDGECGLCHRWVRFALARERGRDLFRFAPLQGPTFQELTSPGERAAMPDSLAVRTADGRLLVRSEAALHVLRRIGGGWGVLARLCGILPRVLRDLAYDCVARMRKHLFRRPETTCPVVSAELVRRFDP